jgi:hypothetical protein
MKLLRPTTLLVVAAGLVLFTGATRASAHSESIQVTGRFVCAVGDEQVPLAGAHPALSIEHKSGYDAISGSGPPAGVQRTTYTGSDGAFEFDDVSSTGYYNYSVQAWLYDDEGLSVRAWSSALPIGAGTVQLPHHEDSGTLDFGTNQFPSPACGVFEAVRQAEANYRDIVGSGPPYGDLHVDFGGPTEGFPWADGSSIEWPQGYAGDDEAALNVAAAHAFALTVENFAFKGSSLLQEAMRWDVRVRTDPCTSTTPEVAFYEGFASYWAGDFAPAPDCGGVSQNDNAVEGMVAWRLTKMEHLCTTASRRQMIATLLKSGRSIHSIDDFAAALGPCNAGFLDPSRVQRVRWAAQVDAGRFVNQIKAQAQQAQIAANRIASKFDAARDAARQAVCPPFPCGKAIAAKLGPSLLSGAIQQEKLLATALAAEVSPSAQKQLTGPPTEAFLRSVLTTPVRITRSLAAIGAASISAGLRAAAPLAQREHAARPADLNFSNLTGLAQLKSYYRRVAAGDLKYGRVAPEVPFRDVLPVSGVTATPADARARRVPWSGRIHFFTGGGYVVKNIQGVEFGGPHTLGFPGDAGPEVCEAWPEETGDGVNWWAALAHSCPAVNRPGDYVTGTMMKFPSPVQKISLGIGAKRFDSLGHYYPIAVVLTAYDAKGRLVRTETTTVIGNLDGKVEKTLTLDVGKSAGATYLELNLNNYDTWQTQVSFNELTWIGA